MAWRRLAGGAVSILAVGSVVLGLVQWAEAAAQPAKAPAPAPVSSPAAVPVSAPAASSHLAGQAVVAPASKTPANDGGIRVLLTPQLETTLVSQFVGRISAVHVGLGSAFPAGKALISFDCSEQAARLRMSEAELAAARQTHEAKLRLQGLQQAGEVEVALAASSADKAQAQVALSRAQMSQCSVSAPFAGRAVKLLVKPSQAVSQGQPLLEVVSNGPLKLRVNAPSRWLAWLKVGTRFQVDIEETAKRYPARVTAINGRVDAVSQSIELEAMIDKEAPELLAGMSGTALFTPPQ